MQKKFNVDHLPPEWMLDDAGETVTELPMLITQKELAQYVGKSISWAEQARFRGEGPPFVKLGRHVRYRVSDVLDWIEQNVRNSTGEGD